MDTKDSHHYIAAIKYERITKHNVCSASVLFSIIFLSCISESCIYLEFLRSDVIALETLGSLKRVICCCLNEFVFHFIQLCWDILFDYCSLTLMFFCLIYYSSCILFFFCLLLSLSFAISVFCYLCLLLSLSFVISVFLDLFCTLSSCL